MRSALRGIAVHFLPNEATGVNRVPMWQERAVPRRRFRVGIANGGQSTIAVPTTIVTNEPLAYETPPPPAVVAQRRKRRWTAWYAVSIAIILALSARKAF